MGHGDGDLVVRVGKDLEREVLSLWILWQMLTPQLPLPFIFVHRISLLKELDMCPSAGIR